MGADLTLLNENHGNAEPTADLLVRTSSLKACTIEGDIIPTLIDELPTIAMMACFAEGTTVIRDAAELSKGIQPDRHHGRKPACDGR